MSARLKARLILLTLVLLFGGPLVISYWLYNSQAIHKTLATVQHGEFIAPPVAMAKLSVTGLDGRTSNLNSFHGHWLMLYFAPYACEDVCQKALSLQHQIHVALHKNSAQVQRVVLASDAAQSLPIWQKLQERDPGLHIGFINEQQVSRLQKIVKSDEERLLLVDPAANVLMDYQADASGKGILQDLKRLLKVSQWSKNNT